MKADYSVSFLVIVGAFLTFVVVVAAQLLPMITAAASRIEAIAR